jgi:hypothetical protein
MGIARVTLKVASIYFAAGLVSFVQAEMQQRSVKSTILALSSPVSSLPSTNNSKQSSKGWLPSRKGFSFSLSGELELEYVDSESNNDAGNTPYGHFQVDKFTLLPLIKIDEDITFGSLLLFKSSSARVDEVYIKFNKLVYDSQFKIGADDRITNEWPKRRTEAFALIDSAFARDDEMGVTWSRSRSNDFFWSVTLSNGYKLGKSSASEDKSYKFLHDDRQTSDANQNKTVGLGIGWNLNNKKSNRLGIMLYGYSGKLSDDDLTIIQSIAGYGASNDKSNYRYGFALNATAGNWNYGAKNIIARDGVLNRDGWYVQAGHTFKFSGSNYLRSVEPFIRYGEMNVDLINDVSDSLTWDRSMTTFAVLLSIRNNFKIKIEYYLNGEQTGAGEVDNDETVIQFEAKF